MGNKPKLSWPDDVKFDDDVVLARKLAAEKLEVTRNRWVIARALACALVVAWLICVMLFAPLWLPSITLPLLCLILCATHIGVEHSE
jgi:hypothetical protein